MIEVAITSMEQALVADGETVPEGSDQPEREPMTIGGRPVTADGLGPADLEPPAA
jgi:hypothetical protein